MAWLAATLEARRLTGEIVSAAARISELVASVKTYSHLGRDADQQPTDVRQGIDSTLIMLGHELKAKSIRVVRVDAPDLPEIPAYPGELNQVWTNLIDNAVDVLPPGGELRVETAREAEQVVVRVIDAAPASRPSPVADLRALLHHQRRGGGDGPRPRHRPAHRAPARRADRRGVTPRAYRLHGAAARGEPRSIGDGLRMASILSCAIVRSAV